MTPWQESASKPDRTFLDSGGSASASGGMSRDHDGRRDQCDGGVAAAGGERLARRWVEALMRRIELIDWPAHHST
jgi:hypothetical protein